MTYGQRGDVLAAAARVSSAARARVAAIVCWWQGAAVLDLARGHQLTFHSRAGPHAMADNDASKMALGGEQLILDVDFTRGDFDKRLQWVRLNVW